MTNLLLFEAPTRIDTKDARPRCPSAWCAICAAPSRRNDEGGDLRERPFFFAFDLIALNGADLRRVPLIARKRLLHGIMPTVDSRVRYVDHIDGRGTDFYRLACERDLEGIVAKWRRGTYQSDGATSWLKIKNPDYSQAVDRHELFEKRRPKADRARWAKPELVLS